MHPFLLNRYTLLALVATRKVILLHTNQLPRLLEPHPKFEFVHTLRPTLRLSCSSVVKAVAGVISADSMPDAVVDPAPMSTDSTITHTGAGRHPECAKRLQTLLVNVLQRMCCRICVLMNRCVSRCPRVTGA